MKEKIVQDPQTDARRGHCHPGEAGQCRRPSVDPASGRRRSKRSAILRGSGSGRGSGKERRRLWGMVTAVHLLSWMLMLRLPREEPRRLAAAVARTAHSVVLTVEVVNILILRVVVDNGRS